MDRADRTKTCWNKQRKAKRIHAQHNRRGVALLLVMIAVATSFILAFTFMNAQVTSTAIAKNVQGQTSARQIAESGLILAIAEVRTNASYREKYTSGVWVSDLSLYGGTFTIKGEDGIDEDGDGVVDGDGDLTDDNSDPITLTSVATFNGASHTARAIIRDSRQASVATVAVMDSIEVKGGGSERPFIDSWNSGIGSYASTKESKAVVSTNSTASDKLKVKENGQIRGDVFVGPGGNVNQVVKLESGGTITGTKNNLVGRVLIPGVAMPALAASTGDFTLNSSQIVNTDMHVNKFKLESNAILTIEGDVTIWAEGDVEIKDNAQIIIEDSSTLTFYTGTENKKFKVESNARINVDSQKPDRLTVYRSSQEKIELAGNSQTYATFVMPSAELKIKDNAQFFGSSRSKLLKIEKDGQYHLDLKPKFVKVDDVYIDLGGSDYGVAALEKIEIKSNSRILPLDSGVTARVSVNTVLQDTLKIKDSAVVTGDLYVGPTGNTATVIKYEGSGTLVGTENALDHSVDIVEIDTPTMPASTGDKVISSGKTTVATDQHWNKLEIKSTGILEIDGNINILVDGDFKMEDAGQIQMKGNATLNLYLKKKAEIKKTSKINTDKANPDKVNIFFLLGGENSAISEDAIGYAHIHAPDIKIELKDNATWHGTVRCREFKMDHDSRIFVPLGVGAGQGENGPASTFYVQWIESP